MSRIVIHLLDPAEGHPLQTWNFEDRTTITIGRAPDNDVVVADPYVSRTHAVLQRDGGGWRLTSISRQGLRCDGEERAEIQVTDGIVCRLGPNGCLLRIGDASNIEESTILQTFERSGMPAFVLDQDKMRHEVDQIAEGEYFAALSHTVRQMREHRLAQ